MTLKVQKCISFSKSFFILKQKLQLPPLFCDHCQTTVLFFFWYLAPPKNKTDKCCLSEIGAANQVELMLLKWQHSLIVSMTSVGIGDVVQLSSRKNVYWRSPLFPKACVTTNFTYLQKLNQNQKWERKLRVFSLLFGNGIVWNRRNKTTLCGFLLWCTLTSNK